jgi:hypothetical protein
MKHRTFSAELTLGSLRSPITRKPCIIDEIEVHPVAEYTQPGPGGEMTFMEQCEPDDSDLKFWSVYIHYKEGGLECIADCKKEKDAEALRTWLINFAKNFKPWNRPSHNKK